MNDAPETPLPITLDPYDHGFHWDPYPFYRAARERDPVYFYEPGGFWLLTKWDDVNAARRGNLPRYWVHIPRRTDQPATFFR